MPARTSPPSPGVEVAAQDAHEEKEATTPRKEGREPPELEEVGLSAHQRSSLERPHETNDAAGEETGEETTVPEREGGAGAVGVAGGFGVNSGGGLVEGGETVGEGEEGSRVILPSPSIKSMYLEKPKRLIIWNGGSRIVCALLHPVR